MSKRWRFIEGDLDLDTMQGYVSESQWEIDTTDGPIQNRLKMPIRHILNVYS